MCLVLCKCCAKSKKGMSFPKEHSLYICAPLVTLLLGGGLTQSELMTSLSTLNKLQQVSFLMESHVSFFYAVFISAIISTCPSFIRPLLHVSF